MKKFLILISVLATLASSNVFAFGAIAVDDEEGETEPGYGFVTGEDNKDTARSEALKECKKAGGENCKVVVWFKQCGAYAASKKYYGYGYGSNKGKAIADALEMCGQKSCKIAIAECE